MLSLNFGKQGCVLVLVNHALTYSSTGKRKVMKNKSVKRAEENHR